MKPTISKPFKSNDRTFEKVFGLFNKKDYFNVKGLAKVQIGNFERALQKNDKNAQQVLDMFKGDEKKAKEYIIQVIHDRKKEQAFNDYKALKDAVDSIQKGKPNVGAVDYVKRIIHNSSQKYSIALYSTLRNKKFTKWKDVHDDIDDLIGESVNEGKKRYYQQDRVGSAKYTISYHDGKKKHKDGSDFFDIQTFKNKKDLAKFVNTLHKGGYVYGFNESLNEVKEPEVISQLRDIVKRKQNKKIKDPISGKMMRVDLYSASAITQVYDAINKSNKDKFGKLSLPKMVNVAFSVIKKESVGVNEMDPHYPVVSSDDEEVAESKTQINQLKKKVGKKEIKFYDALSKLEKKMGSRYNSFLDKSLKDFKLNPSKFRTNGDKEEKLFQVSEINTNEDLRNWFKKKWVNIGKKDKSGKHPPCGTSGKKSGYAKCVPAAKAKSMSKKEKESATRRKRAAQNKAGRGGSQGGGGRKPINVSTHTGGRKSGTGKGS